MERRATLKKSSPYRGNRAFGSATVGVKLSAGVPAGLDGFVTAGFPGFACGSPVGGGVTGGGVVAGGGVPWGAPCGDPGVGVVAGGGVPCGGGVPWGGGVAWAKKWIGLNREPFCESSCASAGITELNPANPTIISKNKTYHFLITQGSAKDSRPTCDRKEGYPFAWTASMNWEPTRS